MVLIPPQILHEMRGFCCWKWLFYHEKIEHSLWQLQMYGNSHLCSGGRISQFLQWISAFSDINGKYFTLEQLHKCPWKYQFSLTAWVLAKWITSIRPYMDIYYNTSFSPVKGKNACTSQRQGTQGTVYQSFTKNDKCVLPQASLYMSLLYDTTSTVLRLKILLYI